MLAALEDDHGTLHAPDNPRLAGLGMAQADGRGRYFLTEDGRAIATELRQRERDLITDEMLSVILDEAPRATAQHSGWISGATSYEQRSYIELVRLPETPADMFIQCVTGTLKAVRSYLGEELGVHTEIDGTRLLFGALRPSRRGATPHLGEPDRAREDRVSAMQHADAVWADLCSEGPGATLRMGHEAAGGDRSMYRPPVALHFHYCSRDARLSLGVSGRYVVKIISGPDTGREWTGHRADVAVKAMGRDLYGTKCAHGYHTGSDSCPGCDAAGEEFEGRHSVRGPMPHSLPDLSFTY
ncbi:hypothetical protein [Streptomyces griseorubiginosus]|uniref:hypothetical protein n=1 Tax=Streptomyces griseorubiginosus TaxID=67304 RepID=UPI0036E5A626